MSIISSKMIKIYFLFLSKIFSFKKPKVRLIEVGIKEAPLYLYENLYLYLYFILILCLILYLILNMHQ